MNSLFLTLYLSDSLLYFIYLPIICFKNVKKSIPGFANFPLREKKLKNRPGYEPFSPIPLWQLKQLRANIATCAQVYSFSTKHIYINTIEINSRNGAFEEGKGFR